MKTDRVEEAALEKQSQAKTHKVAIIPIASRGKKRLNNELEGNRKGAENREKDKNRLDSGNSS